MFNNIPEVTKNLIILNVLVFLAQNAFPQEVITLRLALHPILNDNFYPTQIITHMFAHGDMSHIFFNMFALLMFGSTIEQAFGPKRFLFFYLATGFGAAFLHGVTQYFEIQHLISSLNQSGTPQGIANAAHLAFNYEHAPAFSALGASGAVYGLLAAFGMLYPNRVIMLLIPPIPMKAKYFVLIFGAIELYMGIQGRGSGIAHFAHVGGALFGALIILFWRYRGERF